MHFVLIAILLLILILGPGLWVRRVMARYGQPADRYDETGAEVARRLLDARGLHAVGVEVTASGDHYDPEKKVVRLSESNHSGRSLTAVTVSAHEVGHAVQDAERFAPLRWRTRLVRLIGPIEKTGAVLLMASPLIMGITRIPVTGLLLFLGGMLSLGSTVVIHLLTLPTEFDASFNRALPLMKERGILFRPDEKHARRLLRAAAMTYVAASLMSLLNIARWWAILRR